MSENRFYVDLPLVENQVIELSPEELHHLRVMRKKEGEWIELVNGKNQLAEATIVKLEKKTSLFRLHSVQTKNTEKRNITLCQALFESNKIEWIVEKTTELGVNSIWFFPATRSKKRVLSEHEKTRLMKHSIASMKQSGRWDLPKIEVFPSLQALPLSSSLYFGDIHKESFSYSFDPQQDCMIVIGPPSGFTEKEEEYLLSKKAIGISLSKNILRAETAAVVAIGLAARL